MSEETLRARVEDAALRLLGRREYSRQHLTEKLKKRFPENERVLEEICDNFEAKGWLSDKRFCEAFIHDQQITTRSGPFRIQQKLSQKGVDASVIEACLQEDFPPEKQQDVLCELIQQKRKTKRFQEASPQQQKEYLLRYLQQKGYSYDVIRDSLERCEG